MHKQTCKRTFYNQKPNSKKSQITNHSKQLKKSDQKTTQKTRNGVVGFFSFGLKINHFMGCGSSLAGCIQSQGVRVPNSSVNVCQKTEIFD
jgi:hypothetical protein